MASYLIVKCHLDLKTWGRLVIGRWGLLGGNSFTSDSERWLA
jgi:hypothetical protein